MMMTATDDDDDDDGDDDGDDDVSVQTTQPSFPSSCPLVVALGF